MKFGLTLARANPGLWPQLTAAAEELGFESVWVPEHLVLPVAMAGSPHDGEAHPPIPGETPVFDAMAYLSFLAGRTSTIRFGTHVYNIGLRHPFVTARAVATLDIVSGGRFEFGIGASWLREEWLATGLDFHTRGRRVDEALSVARRLWTDKTVEEHGEFFDFDPVFFEPKPVQAGGPPVHVGGDGAAALRRVARFGDGWLPMNHTLAQLPASLDTLRGLWREYGREGQPVVTMSLPVTGTDDVDQASAAGVDRLIVAPWQRSSGALDGIAEFAQKHLATS